MYAAMPAVLKDAIEKSYEKVGWNLHYSKCEPLVFPTFKDIIEMLPEVMDSSLYSSDTKSDYSGALITRVKSLTNGINGQIFCSNNEVSNQELFENNVIIDLSRVGSSETRSLLMGIIVMKLQEYRLDLDCMNEKLKHVTVLEEAHNLLRKTSTGQFQEGANLQGKSVEMITNAIAEMRTYGEGFIIADQAPELLDEAVIRNTNTKIALRLPNEIDRRTVGTAMALNDNQILELSRLPKGGAADRAPHRHLLLYLPASVLFGGCIPGRGGAPGEILAAAAVCRPVPPVYRRPHFPVQGCQSGYHVPQGQAWGSGSGHHPVCLRPCQKSGSGQWLCRHCGYAAGHLR